MSDKLDAEPLQDRGPGPKSGHLPASEEGAGLIPEDREEDGRTHLPESEADSDALKGEGPGETQSWPGRGGPGTFPPPG